MESLEAHQLNAPLLRALRVYALGLPCPRVLHRRLLQGRDLLDSGELVAEDVEDIANSAVKELQIEDKLNTISEEWADEQFAFAQVIKVIKAIKAIKAIKTIRTIRTIKTINKL